MTHDTYLTLGELKTQSELNRPHCQVNDQHFQKSRKSVLSLEILISVSTCMRYRSEDVVVYAFANGRRKEALTNVMPTEHNPRPRSRCQSQHRKVRQPFQNETR